MINLDKTDALIISAVIVLCYLNTEIYGVWWGVGFTGVTILSGFLGYEIMDRVGRKGD